MFYVTHSIAPLLRLAGFILSPSHVPIKRSVSIKLNLDLKRYRHNFRCFNDGLNRNHIQHNCGVTILENLYKVSAELNYISEYFELYATIIIFFPF